MQRQNFTASHHHNYPQATTFLKLTNIERILLKLPTVKSKAAPYISGPTFQAVIEEHIWYAEQYMDLLELKIQCMDQAI
jgi:hypothetical protein